jgi:hypothetical protein
MATLIEKPADVEAAGTPPKHIEEFFGRIRNKTDVVSIAQMRSLCGWTKPGQTAVCLPAFSPETVHRYE